MFALQFPDIEHLKTWPGTTISNLAMVLPFILRDVVHTASLKRSFIHHLEANNLSSVDIIQCVYYLSEELSLLKQIILTPIQVDQLDSSLRQQRILMVKVVDMNSQSACFVITFSYLLLQLWPDEVANRPNMHTGLHFKTKIQEMGHPQNYDCSFFETRHKPNKVLGAQCIVQH